MDKVLKQGIIKILQSQQRKQIIIVKTRKSYFFFFLMSTCTWLCLIIFLGGNEPLVRFGTHFNHTKKKKKSGKSQRQHLVSKQFSPVSLTQNNVGYLRQLPHSNVWTASLSFTGKKWEVVTYTSLKITDIELTNWVQSSHEGLEGALYLHRKWFYLL